MADGRFVPSNHQAGTCHATRCARTTTWLGASFGVASLRPPSPRTVEGAGRNHWCAASCREPRPWDSDEAGDIPSYRRARPGLHLVAILPHARRCDAGAVSHDQGNCARFNPPHALHPNCPDTRSDTTLFPFLSPGAQIIGRAGLFSNLQETSRLALPPILHTTTPNNRCNVVFFLSSVGAQLGLILSSPVVINYKASICVLSLGPDFHVFLLGLGASDTSYMY